MMKLLGSTKESVNIAQKTWDVDFEMAVMVCVHRRKLDNAYALRRWRLKYLSHTHECK